MERALSLKSAANASFGQKKFAEAIVQYTDALRELSSDESALSSKEGSKLKSVLLANRAACHLKSSPPNASAALADCEASLEMDPSYTKALFRKAQAQQALGGDHLSDALVSYTRLLSVDAGNKPAARAASQVRVVLQQQKKLERNPAFFVDKLRNGTSQDVGRDIHTTMVLYMENGINKQAAHACDFPGWLLSHVLEGCSSSSSSGIPTTTLPAAKALSAILRVVNGSDKAAAAAAAGKGNAKTQLQLSPAFVNNISRLLGVVGAPITEAARRLTPELCRELVLLLGGLASVKQLQEQRPLVMRQLLLCLTDDEAAKDGGDDDDENHSAVARLARTKAKAGLAAVAVACERDYEALGLVRESALPVLLFSPLTEAAALRPDLLSCLAVVSGARAQEKDSDDAPAKDEQAKKEEQFRDTIAKFINMALLNDDFEVCSKAVSALGVLIQANAELGVFVVNHGQKKGPQGKMGKLAELAKKAAKAKAAAAAAESAADGATAAAATSDDNSDEQKQEEQDDESKQEEEEEVDEDVADKPTMEQVEAEEAPKKKEEEGHQVPFPLAKLIRLTDMPTPAGSSEAAVKALRLRASQVLALASSDTLVRSTIMATCGAELYSEQLRSNDLAVCTVAALALSKLAAVGELEQTKGEQKAVLAAVMGALEKSAKRQQQQEEEQRQQKDKTTSNNKNNSSSGTSTKDAVANQVLRNVSETLAYLSLHIEAKKALAMTKRGAWLELVFKLARSADQAVRYALITVVRNLTTSQDAVTQEFNAEVAALRKVAQKGLPGAEQQAQRAKQRAGSAQAIKVITRLLVKAGVVSFLGAAMKEYKISAIQAQDALERSQEKASGGEGKAGSAATTTALPAAGTPGFGGASPVVAEAMGASLLVICDDQENRGAVVQQSGLRLLLDLYQLQGEHMRQPSKQAEQQFLWRRDASLALARVGITTNPHLYPEGVGMDMVAPLLALCRTTNHELHQFEALLTLTNLASCSEDLREKIFTERGWGELTVLLAADNFRVQRAAMECMCNLVMCEKAFERFHQEGAEQDLRYFLMFAATNDVATQCAATGALAMLSQDPVLAKKILSLRMTPIVVEEVEEEEEENVDGGVVVEEVPDSDDDDDDKKGPDFKKFGDASAKMKDARAKANASAAKDARTGLTVLLGLLKDPATDPNVKVRVEALFSNVQEQSS